MAASYFHLPRPSFKGYTFKEKVGLSFLEIKKQEREGEKLYKEYLKQLENERKKLSCQQ